MPRSLQASKLAAGPPQVDRLPSGRELLWRAHNCESSFVHVGRCGACDVGYYGVSGQCYECGHKSLVLFLAYVVPVLMSLALTCFLFWSGIIALPRHPQRLCLIEGAMAMWVSCSFVGVSIARHGAVS